MRARLLLAIPASLGTTPVWAHPGEHGRMSAVELLNHFAGPDHMALLALAVFVGWLGYRYGRHVEARAMARVKQSDEGGTR